MVCSLFVHHREPGLLWAQLAPLLLEKPRPRRAPGQQPGTSCPTGGSAARSPQRLEETVWTQKSHCIYSKLITTLFTSLAWTAAAVASIVTVTGSFCLS